MKKEKKAGRKKIFSIRKKLLLTILPLFLLSFTLLTALMYIQSGSSMLKSAKSTLLMEAQSNAKTVAINLLISTGGSSSTTEA